ncbi:MULTISPECIES: alcohol dehydrogenase catalytic domain-containing protein [Streptosporangium]|uniref:alcohol dehydrogenase n=1 Tax=Streptosporangium brasiliense TaxID=47480 RepID=A0ABT9RLY6_9ACTN|nr:alcohol dehydrogenase catalytic domain-containing protein [Streptosporangium brasiliense]MDP9870270.1 alcohol dehydrogenase/propanol-preferring alcohol dehydrogenase [Streptosporangium brasiliense]
MKAAVIPEVNAAWELREVPTPRPGPGEVLIRVHASGICHNDVLATRGIIPFPAFSPAVTGHEPVGEVVEVGAGVTSRKVGDRVGTTWIQGTCGRCDYCALELPVSGQAAFRCAAPAMTGFTVPGGHAEYMVAAASGTVLLPDGLDYELAAPVLCAGYTAWSAFRVGAPRPKERVAVLGIGGLGHLALQFAAAGGFETVAITRSPDKHALARELGADTVVGSGEELLAAGGADVILATGPSYAAATDSMRGLRLGGRIVLAGIDGLEPFTLAPDLARPFFAQRHQVLGATHEGPQYLKEALEVVASGKVTPKVEVFDKTQVAEALDKVAKGEVRFKAVVTY